MPAPMRAHQQLEFDRHKDDHARALLWYMRSGKTRAMIDLGFHLHVKDRIRLAIVVAPNGVHRVWPEEQLPQHAWEGVEWNALAIDSAKVGTKAFDEHLSDIVFTPDMLWLTLIKEALNVERVRNVLYNVIQESHRGTLLIVDECHHFGNASSQRWRHLKALAARCEYKRILTGTEATDGLEKLWPQFEIVQHKALGAASQEAFNEKYCETVMVKVRNKNGFVQRVPKIVGYKNVETLQERVDHWSSRVTREDADLPPLVPMTRVVPLPKDLAGICRKALEDGELPKEAGEDAWGEARSCSGLSGLAVLGQLSSGFIYDAEGVAHELCRNPRLDVLADFLETVPDDEQAIIWCAYRHEVDQVHAMLGGGRDVARYYSDQGNIERTLDLKAFKNGACHTLVGTPQSGGEGLELGNASVIIWFSHVTSGRIRQQASERASSSGDSVAVVDLVADCKSDRWLAKMHRNKANVADLVKGRSLYEVLDEEP